MHNESETLYDRTRVATRKALPTLQKSRENGP